MNRDFRHEDRLNRFLAATLSNSSSANIRINLRATSHLSNTEEEASRVARRFRSEINQFFFGNKARRFEIKNGLFITSSLHTDKHPHLHIVCEIPSGRTLDDIRTFLDRFTKKHLFLGTNYYIEQTNNALGSQKYNARHGEDTVVDF